MVTHIRHVASWQDWSVLPTVECPLVVVYIHVYTHVYMHVYTCASTHALYTCLHTCLCTGACTGHAPSKSVSVLRLTKCAAPASNEYLHVCVRARARAFVTMCAGHPTSICLCHARHSVYRRACVCMRRSICRHVRRRVCAHVYRHAHGHMHRHAQACMHANICGDYAQKHPQTCRHHASNKHTELSRTIPAS